MMSRRFRKARRAVADSDEEEGIQSGGDESGASTSSSIGSGEESGNEDVDENSTKIMKTSNKSSLNAPPPNQSQQTQATLKKHANLKSQNESTSNKSNNTDKQPSSAAASSKDKSRDKKRYELYVGPKQRNRSLVQQDGVLGTSQSPSAAATPLESSAKASTAGAESTGQDQRVDTAHSPLPETEAIPPTPQSADGSINKPQKAQIRQDPTMVPSRGPFWGHDDRSELSQSAGGMRSDEFERGSTIRGRRARGGSRGRYQGRRGSYVGNSHIHRASGNSLDKPPEDTRLEVMSKDRANDDATRNAASPSQHAVENVKTEMDDPKMTDNTGRSENKQTSIDKSNDQSQPRDRIHQKPHNREQRSSHQELASGNVIEGGVAVGQTEAAWSDASTGNIDSLSQQLTQDGNRNARNRERKDANLHADVIESSDRNDGNVPLRRQELWTPGDASNSDGRRSYIRGKSEPKWTHDMYTDETTSQQDKTKRKNRDKKTRKDAPQLQQQQNQGKPPVSGNGSTTTSSGLTIRINKRQDASANQEKSINTATTTLKSSFNATLEVKAVADDFAGLNVSSAESIIPTRGRETSTKSKRYITRKDRSSVGASSGAEDVLKKGRCSMLLLRIAMLLVMALV